MPAPPVAHHQPGSPAAPAQDAQAAPAEEPAAANPQAQEPQQPGPDAPAGPPPADPEVDINYKANTCYELSVFAGEGMDLRRITPCVDVSQRPYCGMITFALRRKKYRPTRALRIQEKMTKPQDWQSDVERVITVFKDFVHSKGKVLRKVFVCFEKHHWVDPDTGTFGVHIHLVWQTDGGFAWYHHQISKIN
jgi:hypothetical protein